MIRRTIWLTAGAVIGVAGYRRLDRAAKALTGRPGFARSGPVATLPAVRQSARVQAAPAQLAPARPAVSLSAAAFRGAVWLVRRLRASAGFLAEVRAGMDEYLDAAQPGLRPGPQPVPQPGRRPVPPPNINRQHARARNTLGGQRAAIGAEDHDAIKDGR